MADPPVDDIFSTITTSSLIPILLTVLIFSIPLLVIFPPVPVSLRDALAQTHRRLGVAPSRSLIPDSITRPCLTSSSSSDQTPKVHSLWIFPIKSCQGIELDKARVVYTGLEYDRVYTFAQLKGKFPAKAATTTADCHDSDKPKNNDDSETWEFITLRQFPRLATVKVSLYLPDATKTSRALGPCSTHEPYILVRFPTPSPSILSSCATKLSRRSLSAVPETEILLPLTYPSADEITSRGWTTETVKIWRDTLPALNLERELPKELAAYLGVSNRLGLFRMDPAQRHKREIFRNAPRKGEVGYQPVVDFQDGYPLNLMNIHSVQALNERVPKDERIQDIDIRRYRANIIVSNAPPFDEESWQHLALRTAADPSSSPAPGEFIVACRSVRCKLPNVHPTSGQRHDAQPERALRQWRGDVDPGAPRKGCMGMQLCALFPDDEKKETVEGKQDQDGGEDKGHLDELGFEIEAGMGINVVQRGEHVYIAYDHQKAEMVD